MKKILLIFILVSATYTSFAQIKVGLRVAPGIGLNKVEDKNSSDLTIYSKGDASLAFTIGPDIDFFLNDNIVFCTGLWWSTRKVSVQRQDLFLISAYTSNLQYLQIPITFKAYTNEISKGLKIYAQLGGLIETKISDKLKSSSPDLTTIPGYIYEKRYQYVNVGLYAGTGIEYALNGNNAVYVGVFYQRGLINQARNFKNSFTSTQNDFAKQAKVNLSSLGLEVGFKF